MRQVHNPDGSFLCRADIMFKSKTFGLHRDVLYYGSMANVKGFNGPACCSKVQARRRTDDFIHLTLN